MNKKAVIKRCRQCGDVKSLSCFRPYYNRKSGHYSICKDCEKVNTRYRYLYCKGKDNDLNEDEQKQLDLIQTLYKAQVEAGFKPQGWREIAGTFVEPSIHDIINSQLVNAASMKAENVPVDAPFELTRWLTEDLSGRKPSDNDAVYDKLSAMYRPIKGRGADGMPEYDNKYRSLLLQILERFDEYEDKYYEEGGN